jgi:hypothetical protein
MQIRAKMDYSSYPVRIFYTDISKNEQVKTAYGKNTCLGKDAKHQTLIRRYFSDDDQRSIEKK